MHLRLPFWAVLFVCALGCLQAQPTPPATGAAPAAAGMTNGQIVAKMVTGNVTMEVGGATTAVVNDAAINPGATIVTAADASVVLVFSNGATTQLGPDSSLVIEQFLQSPFKQAVSLATATQEPSTSRTKLKLNKGELLGKVAKLKHDQGSTFEVQTPVGAAGIRGTTFRLVFRPTGTGQAFAVFSLSTLEGNVNFQQGAPDTPGTPPTPGTPTPPTPEGQPEGGVPVVTGQEVVVTIAVEVSASGQVTITTPPVVTSSQPMSVETQAAIARQAEVVATAAATATFQPTPTTGGTEPAPTEGEGEGEKEPEGNGDGNGDGNGTSGGDAPAGEGNNNANSEGNNGNSPNANEGNANAGQNNAADNANNGNANNNNANNNTNATPPTNTPSDNPSPSNTQRPSPAPTTAGPQLTPGAGRPSG